MNILYFSVCIIILWFCFSASRNNILRQIGFRNIFRRKTTSILIIFGSLIATALIAGSLTLGDSFTQSTKIKAERFLGEIDAQITSSDNATQNFKNINTQTKNPINGIFFKESADQIKNALDINKVDGKISLLDFPTSVISKRNKLSVTDADLIAFENTNFDGENISFDIPNGAAIISFELATRLDLHTGDEIDSYNGIKTLHLRIIDVNNNKGVSAFSLGSGNILVSPLYLRSEFDLPKDTFNKIFVSSIGGVYESSYNSREFEQYLSQTTQETNPQKNWNVQELKSQYTTGGFEFVSYAFLAVSSAGVIAGILLLINIYSMLAQERKSEMGTLRAIALTRRNLIKTFLYEGFIYSITSSIIGVFVGIGIGYILLIAVIKVANNVNPNLGIVFYTQPQTWLTSFCIGVLITFTTAFIACLRISKINIVSAIRDTQEIIETKITVWTVIKIIIQVLLLIEAISSVIIGVVLLMLPKSNFKEINKIISVDAIAGYSIFIGLFISCYILSLLISKYLRRTGKNNKINLIVTVLNFPPLILAGYIDKIPLFNNVFLTSLGPTLLLMAGLTIVFTLTIIVSYNLEIFSFIIVKFFKLFGRSSFVLKLSLRYASSSRQRTTLTILMFSIILFLVSFLSVYKATVDKQFETFAPKSGYDAFVSAPSNIDPQKIVQNVANLDLTDDIAVNKSTTIKYKDITYKDLFPNVSQNLIGSEAIQPVSIPLIGYNQNFVDHNPIKLSDRLLSFENDADAVKMTLEDPSKVILSPSYAGTNGKPIDALTTGKVVNIIIGDMTREVQIIGLMDINSPQNYSLFAFGMLTGSDFFKFNQSYIHDPTSEISFKLKESTLSKSESLKQIQNSLIEYNLASNLFSISQIFDVIANILRGAILILQGFLSFALFVGISGISIIMIRSVNERRQQIGMLRAIGFKRKQILFTFFIEASFIILLGIFIGIFSGGLSANIFIHALNSSNNGNRVIIITTPFMEFFIIGLVVYVISIIFTLIPSYQASKLSPVESTNYLD